MATSGTVGHTEIEVATLIEHIVRRCGVEATKITPEIIQTVKNVMFMFMTSLSNRGINMWRVQRGLFGFNTGQATYVMPSGTLDILHAMYRTPVKLTGTITTSTAQDASNLDDKDYDTIFTMSSTGGWIKWDFGATEDEVTLVGLLNAASAVNTLAFEISHDDAIWTAVRTPGATECQDGKWKWFNIEPSIKARYFRIRETSTGTLSYRDVLLSRSWRETAMWRMNRDDYANIPNKRQTGEPRQFWFDRQNTAQLIVWPVPNAATIWNCVSLYNHMQVQDIGAISNTVDIPQRWYDATVANCAFMAILDIPGADLKRYDLLKDQASSTMITAEAEERDASPTNIVSNISAYTA